MRVLIITVLLVVLSGFAAAQDGSDIRYYGPAELTAKLVGSRVHVDFYRKSNGRSRWTMPGADNPTADKVILKVNRKQIEFLERRNDDGYNNWFREQYLEAVDGSMKITEFKLVEIGKDTIKVLATITAEPFSKEFTFDKKDVAQVLVKSNQ